MLKKIWDFTVPFIPLLLIVIISITYSSILIPFIISIIAAYLINPIMVFMEKR